MSTEAETPFETKDDLIRFPSRPTIRMPRNMRELFGLLALYDSNRGLADLLSRIDFTGVGPVEIYRLVHARAPESPQAAPRRPGFNAADKMGDALVSPEFRGRLLHHFLRAFPEKRRDVFIHVPKCAGTDLSLNLAPRRLSFPTMLETVGTEEEFLACLGTLCRSIGCFDDIFVYGHIRLGDYIAAAGVQPGDRIFTVIREPIDMLISQVSDALGQVLRDPQARDATTRERLEWLGIDRVPPNPSGAFAKEIAIKGMLDARIAPHNPVCDYLGTAPDATYRSAMTNIVVHDVEVTTLPHYSKWLADRWQINAGSRHNASTRLVSVNEVQRFLHEKVREQHVDDRKLYDVVAWCLARKGGSSISGLEIAEMAGDSLLEDFPEHIRAEAKNGAAGASWYDPLPFIAAEGHSAIQCFAIPFPIGDNAFCETVVQTISFEVDGNSDAFRRDGWSKPEERWTWTADHSCTLEIPRPAFQDNYILRIQVRPFTVPGRVPCQRVELAINGTKAATGIVREASILECDVPWELLSQHETIALTFGLPDAARPTEVNAHPNDARLLGLAFERLKLVRFDKPQIGAPVAPEDVSGERPTGQVLSLPTIVRAEATVYDDSDQLQTATAEHEFTAAAVSVS